MGKFRTDIVLINPNTNRIQEKLTNVCRQISQDL